MSGTGTWDGLQSPLEADLRALHAGTELEPDDITDELEGTMGYSSGACIQDQLDQDIQQLQQTSDEIQLQLYKGLALLLCVRLRLL